ncbi:MAG: penicillin-binding protein activator [Desulfamplus sp.]|nr:penicillin-binding protein activator [Desulfamplus sp.]
MVIKIRYMVTTIIYLTLLLSLASCANFQPEPPKKHRQPQIVLPSVPDQVEQSHYAAIEQKGNNDVKSGNYRLALNSYNTLISKYSGEDKKRILAKTEALLSIMKNSDLEVVLSSKKSHIPESMLLYRVGMNYAQKQKDNQKAKEVLTRFVLAYPNDPKIAEVQEILKNIETLSFSKNTIGCMLPLSGKYERFGKQALRGIQVAEQELKELYKDQEIVFIVKDTESKDDKAIECIKELAQTNAAAIAGPMVTSEAAAKEAQEQQIPMICMTQKSEVTATGDYIFSNFITPEIQIEGLVYYAKEVMGIDNFAVISPNDKYGERFTSLFKDAVVKGGGEIVVSEVYSDNQTDFSDAIKKLVSVKNAMLPALESELPSENSEPQQTDTASAVKIAIFIPDSPAKVGMILPQFLYHNFKDAYLLGTNIWHNNALLKISPEHLQNVVITDGYFPKSTKPEAARFAEAFKAVYGEYPGFIESIAYDTASMLIKTAMDSVVDSRLTLKNALAGNIIYNGATGETMFEPNGNAKKELFFITIKDNQFVEIGR